MCQTAFRGEDKLTILNSLNEHDTNHELGFDQEVFVSPDWNVFLHETEVVEATEEQPAAVHPQVEVHLLAAVPAHGPKALGPPSRSPHVQLAVKYPDPLPVEVVLHVLRQVHVQHDKVVQVRPTEGLARRPASQVAAPLAGSAHRVQGDLWRDFHVLQHHLQGDVGIAWATVRRLAERQTQKIKER